MVNRFLPPADFVAAYGTDGQTWQLTDALAYTQWLARRHYENFHVVTFLLPRRLHQDFYNVYSFCRWADDLGDEIGDPQRSLQLLRWWRRELADMYGGKSRHPVFVALQQTVESHRLPEQPFAHLIRAFVQDQSVTRYQTYAKLLDYCVYSANPVGRLVLLLCGYSDAERFQLSDFTCTALQLANFWQDVRRDWEKGRVYIPLEDMARHGHSVEALEEDLQKGTVQASFRALMRELVERTHALFLKGLPLVNRVDRRLALDVELFSRGGIAILERIRRQDYDVISRRPRLGEWDRILLLLCALGSQLFTGSRARTGAQHVYR